MSDVRWHKSSYSGGSHQDCVEVAESPDLVRVRDTRNRESGHLTVTSGEWAAFLADVRADRL
ncbi:uncharacterized protein DUF397 [Haloactinospora alba]|uniref:Uncharacterized protein DUF397 n=1 Tax=Haloactinospora alba TaxID=405555 RepID=A0A543N7J7_9ACTN|nr:DUF397 domain-containing protein [Haloactinospora alba]TQN27804.1 uncharacterized protein DUF397 [Haloactinospora alba]